MHNIIELMPASESAGMLSLANARRRLYAWFHKPLDTMGFNAWNAITDRLLYQPISHVLFYYLTAASESETPEIVLDRLNVVWIWLNKHPDPPEHEYIIVETKDSQDGMTRLFILDRSVEKAGCIPEIDGPNRPTTTTKTSQRPDTGSHQLLGNIQGLSNLIRSPSISGSTTSLSSMEEGALPPTLYPPVSFPLPQHSIIDTLSLSATKTSQAVSDSFDKGGEQTGAFDRIFGDSAILQRRYGFGRNARQIKPNNLKLFELLVLAEAVHDFAPTYSRLGKNCYWFSNILMDAVIEIFGLDHSISAGDGGRETKYTPIDPYQSEISGRSKGWKVSHTNPDDLSRIVHDFKKAHTAIISQVKFFFF